MSNLRPMPNQRCLDGLGRLRNNTDFTAFRAFLEARLEYYKGLLIVQSDEESFTQTQGRARELQDLLKYTTKE